MIIKILKHFFTKKILKHLVNFSDKIPQLFLNRKRTHQLSFQHYKPTTYKSLTHVTLRHGFLD